MKKIIHKKLHVIFIFSICFAVLSVLFIPLFPLAAVDNAYALSASGSAEAAAFPSYSSEGADFFLLPSSGKAVKPYLLQTWIYSYFTYDKYGAPIESASYLSSATAINPDETALIIMDPWIDMPGDHFTNLMNEITVQRIVPLASEMQRTGHQIIILTNDPATISCSTKIHPLLQEMADRKEATLLYHQRYSSSEFKEYFKSRNINTLVYTGFSSTMCVLYRPAGIIPMYYAGDFDILFVPEASYATVSKDSTVNDLEHKSISIMLASNGIAKLIDYNYYLCNLKKISSL